MEKHLVNCSQNFSSNIINIHVEGIKKYYNKYKQ